MSNLLSLGGWYFLPNLITGWVQSAFYAIWIRAGDPKPQPGSRQFITHRRRIQILVVLSYLLYTIYEADWQIVSDGDLYQVLQVPLNVDNAGIKARFKQISRKWHPDKSDGAGAGAMFMHYKNSRDVLLDPVKRYAHDRLGQEALDWATVKSVQDVVSHGIMVSTSYYVITAGTLLFLGYIGYMKGARYWRFTAIAAMWTFEVYIITRPQAPLVLTSFINPLITTFTKHPPYLQFQLVSLMRSILVSFFIALSQVAPLIFPPSPVMGKEASMEQLDRLEMLVRLSDQETSRLMALELTPFAGNTEAMRDLKSGLQRWLVDNSVRSQPQVRDAMGRVLQPRNEAN